MHVLWIGEYLREEFRECHDWLSRQGDLRVTVSKSPAAALSAAAAVEPPPVLIIVAQSWPRQFCASQLDGLRRQFPLARVVRLLGPCCEGDGRSGQPDRAALTLYWHQAIHYWQLDCARWRFGRLPRWGLPLTGEQRACLAARGEQEQTARNAAARLVVVAAPQRDTAEALTAACQSFGYRTLWLRDPRAAQVQRASAVLWALRLGDHREAAQLATLRGAVGPAPILALVDFPRPEDVDRLHGAGLTAVISKPFQLDELCAALQRAGGLACSPAPLTAA